MIEICQSKKNSPLSFEFNGLSSHFGIIFADFFPKASNRLKCSSMSFASSIVRMLIDSSMFSTIWSGGVFLR